jgi:hypothetical protein
MRQPVDMQHAKHGGGRANHVKYLRANIVFTRYFMVLHMVYPLLIEHENESIAQS